MISDILFEASREITDYLKSLPDVYPPNTRLTARILAVQNAMDELRMTLDTAPEEGEAHDGPRAVTENPRGDCHNR